MNFHDARGMLDEIARWVEEHHVEIDWEALKQCKWWVGPADWVPPSKWSLPKPFPRQLTPQMVTNLLLAQESRGLQIPQWIVDPNEQRENVMLVGRGEGGIEPRVAGELTTGLSYWEKFLRQLEAIQLTKVTISLVGAEERKRLVRMVWIEEELRRREVEHNRERVMRQVRGEAKWHLSRKGVKWLLERAKRGNMGSIEELERRGIGSEEEHRRWREINGKLVENARVMRERKDMKKKEIITEEIVEGEVVNKEVELEVVRVGPNPRILTCRYRVGEKEKVCKVMVKSGKNFVKGMKFRMEEPGDSDEDMVRKEAWEYRGELPRRAGRW
jgi:hypothetical protein